MARRTGLAVGVALLLVTAGCATFGPIPFDGGGDRNRTPPPPMTVTVDYVEDGDTLWFTNESGDRVGIRLIGLDTPETRGQNYPDEYRGIPGNASGVAWLDRWGNVSTALMRERVEGKTVRLVFDATLPKRDFYDRLLAYVYLNGTLLNRAFVERGYGRVYPFSFEKRKSFEEAQAAARRADRGLWNYTGSASAPIETGRVDHGAPADARRTGSTDGRRRPAVEHRGIFRAEAVR